MIIRSIAESVLRSEGKTVGVIAIDPTSPYTGGAILGDRVRMQQHHSDPGVFIRSMATRGWLGGLARATMEISIIRCSSRQVTKVLPPAVAADVSRRRRGQSCAQNPPPHVGGYRITGPATVLPSNGPRSRCGTR